MAKWNGRSVVIWATVAGIDGFVMNMDKKVRRGVHVEECGNLKRSFIGPFRSSMNLHHGWVGMALCCRRRAWDRLWSKIKNDEVYKKLVAEAEREKVVA